MKNRRAYSVSISGERFENNANFVQIETTFFTGELLSREAALGQAVELFMTKHPKYKITSQGVGEIPYQEWRKEDV